MIASPGEVRLDDLLRVAGSGDHVNHAFLEEMLVLFIEDNARRVTAAGQAALQGDYAALRSAVHAIKGSAALIGAVRLRDLAAEFELDLVKGRVSNPRAAADELRLEYAAVVETLRGRYPTLSVS